MLGACRNQRNPMCQLMELEAWRWCDLFGYHPYRRIPPGRSKAA